MNSSAEGSDSLDSVLQDAWWLIEDGAADRRSPYHLPAAATVTRDGAPSLRTVVLRGVDRGSRSVRFHTDRRSAKVAELTAEPRLALHFYDPAIQTQLRLFGRASLHSEDRVARKAWDESAAMSRLCYAAPDVPGASVPAPPPAPLIDSVGDGEGFENFCAVILPVERLEWLHLAASGHRRAVFAWNAAGDVTAGWVAP